MENNILFMVVMRRFFLIFIENYLFKIRGYNFSYYIVYVVWVGMLIFYLCCFRNQKYMYSNIKILEVFKNEYIVCVIYWRRCWIVYREIFGFSDNIVIKIVFVVYGQGWVG